MDFTKDDLRVFKAFLDRQPMRGRRFETDGNRLDGGMYLSRVATWETDERGREYVATHELGSRNAQQIHRKLRRMGGGIVREASSRHVADFPSVDDLAAHARREGATHILHIDEEIHIYFRRRDGSYEKAEVWQKDGYWHTQAPGSRTIVRRPPENARPIDRNSRIGDRGRRAGEATRRTGSSPGDGDRERLAGYLAHLIMWEHGVSPNDLVAAYHLTPEEARNVLSDRGAWYGPGGRGYVAHVKHIKKALARKTWFSPPEPKLIPGAGRAYGRYAWLLENQAPKNTDQGLKDIGDIEELQRQLTAVGFNGWGLTVDTWPEAQRYYDSAPHVYRKHDLSEKRRVRARPKQIGWDVVENLDGRDTVVNRVYFDADMSAAQVRRSLIRSDGYPENITVVPRSEAVRGGDASPSTARMRDGAQLSLPGSDEHDGEQYAQDQLESDYFQNWIWEQMVDGAKLAPDARIPLETPADFRRLARRMLKDLDFDTRRQHRASLEFFEGFRRRLNDPDVINYLADELVHIDEQIKKPRAPKAGGSAKRKRRRPRSKT